MGKWTAKYANCTYTPSRPSHGRSQAELRRIVHFDGSVTLRVERFMRGCDGKRLGRICESVTPLGRRETCEQWQSF
ncbi:hypothetical protein PIB30_043778 [Stylosanthes scabra]|uniref:Uncharacterized protein n=1 Tax=Stylosanthes scabra TaxID=79078 RepID=A0ABU6QFX0_9FABA|nr:hypothetical protein [Stylosanthes scabra]